LKPADRRLLRHARVARPYLVVTSAAAVLSAALVVVQAFVLADIVVSPTRSGTGRTSLRTDLLVLGGVVLGRAALAWVSEVSAARAAAGVKSALRASLVAHVVRLGPTWLARQSPGAVAALATRGTDALDGYFARYVPALVTASVVPVVVVIVELSQDLLAGFIILATLPLIPVFGVLVGLATARRTRRQWRSLSTLAGHFLDVVEGLPTLLVFRRARAQLESIRRVTEDHRRATMATLRLSFLSSAVLEFVATIAVALVAVSTGLRLVSGSLDLRTAVVVLVLAPEAYWPLRQVGAQFHSSAEGVAAAEKVFAVLDTPMPPAGAGIVAPRRDLVRAVIRLEHLTVTYDRRQPALDDLNLVVEPGEYVGIAGPSGSGKSTLLGVLLGFVVPTSGRVLVQHGSDVADLSSFDRDEWRSLISWVPQQPWLAAASITDNVRMARPDACDSDVSRALDLAHATGFVDALPAGAATVLGERGVGLSAGQRQRIALARAFLRDSPLVLLDEPTAHLDANSELAVAAAIRRLAVGRTVIAVAHRPAVLADADRVVQLGRGATHEPLVVTAEAAS
jgi:thiol reductant ABC exporter CydD subunit